MNRALAALVNGGILAAALTFVVWAVLRLIPRRLLNASTRYALWWLTLAIAIALPFAYVVPRAAAAPPQAARVQITTFAWGAWVLAAWVTASALLLARLLISWVLLERTKASAEDAPLLRDRACDLAGRAVRVAATADIATPVAVGPLHPSILIPAGLFAELDSEALDQIVVHEAAHLARYDDYALVLQRLIEALLSLHPVIRWIARQLDLEREIACDDRVIAATGQPRRYATCLTRIVELSGGVRASLTAATAADDASHLSRRIEMLLDRTRHTGTRLLKARLTAIAALVCALAWLAGRSPGFVAFASPIAHVIRVAPAAIAAQVAMLPRVIDEPPQPAAPTEFEARVVEDSSGNPLASAEVRFRKAGMRELAADLDTDRQGRVRAPGLAPGEYTLDIVKPNYITATLKYRVPAESLTVRLVRYAAISGRVTDEQGKPVPGIIRAPYGRTIGGTRVTLLTKSEGGEFTKVREQALQEEGVYRMYDVPPGQYAIGVWYDNLKDGSGMQLYPDAAHPRIFSVAGGEEFRDINFQILSRGGFPVSGRVEGATPKEKYALALALPDQPALPLAQTLTADDGSFRFEKIPPGSYDLLAGGPDRGYGANFTLLGPNPKFGRMQVQVAGGNVENLSVPVSGGRSLTISLRARGSDTLPTGCPQTVTFMAELLEPWGLWPQSNLQVTFGKDEKIDHLLPGRVRLTATGLGAGCYQVNHPVLDLTREAPASAAIELAPAGQIRGTLRGGSAAGLTIVLLDAEAQTKIAFPDAQGRFSLDGLAPGRYRIAAQKSRWVADVAKMIEIDVPGGVTEIELPIAKGDK